ncbi:MAG: hypothetical protein JST48_09150 [Bacteroidetes bacterium]|nr:hypothetical protein [Bacteroidota bacterium]
MKWLINIIGWIGALEVLVAYGLNSYQKIKSDSVYFLLLNLTGGFLLIVYTLYLDAIASATVNIVWVIIAVIALLRKFKR